MLTSHDDLPLRYMMTVPSGKEGPLPLVVILHGRGADMADLAGLAPSLDGGYRFLFPNAPKPFQPMPGYSMGWTWFDGWPPARGSVTESRRLLLDFLDAALALYPTPAGKVVLGGFSQGALMSLDCGFRTTQPLAAIVVMSGALFEEEMPPLKPLPVLIAHGTGDDVVPVVHARRTRLVLEEHGLSPEYHELPMGHNVSPEEIEVVREFLERIL
jgi:phospholipase/carboxylesterase